jgi:hypothetical protein
MDYLIWKNATFPGLCALLSPNGIKRSWQLERGISRAEDWEPSTFCRMNDRFPKDIELADNMSATGLIVVSNEIKELLTAADVGDVEFLPLTIRNHKDKVAAENYWIVNPLSVVDCIDADASAAVFSPLKKDLITNCARLVLKSDNIPEDRKVFRPQFMPTIILVRADIATDLETAGFSGLSFVEPEKFTGI